MFARSLKTMFAAALLTLSVVPAAAFADSATNTGDASSHVRQEKKEKQSFPMTATAFEAKVDGHIAKRREHLAAHMAKKNVAADKQKAALAKFDQDASKVDAEVAKVSADGTVTKEEAQQVREVGRANHVFHGKKGHKHGSQTRAQK